MPRTPIPYTPLAANAPTAAPAGTAIDATLVTNGAALNDAGPDQTVLRVTNTAGNTKTFTVKAGDSGAAAWMAGQGGLTVSVAAGGDVFVGPLDSARFNQRGGQVHIDFASGFTGAITALRVPKYS
ncbi:hypothetical protein [Streptomyces sp. NPDC052225]|uniref:hypothetical protein n=1 Tax=Streptomyces sp. NPDC052225 TaxID=3154949 RepID=UPI0034264FDE